MKSKFKEMLGGTEKIVHYKNNVVGNPLLSVIILAYNHEVYISKCIENALKQEVKFNFEIIIGEDFSSDKTRDICKSYAESNPDMIRLILNDRSNVIYHDGSPTGRYNLMYCFSQARGKYIALCDGDDYWTNKYKIQKQVAFLEANEEYSYCGHKSKSKSNSDINKISLNLQEFGFKELLQKNFLNTSTLMFRQDSIKDLPAIFKNVPAGDWYLQLFAIKNSKAYVLPDYMSVYRLHEKGVWSNLNNRERCLNGVKTLEGIKQLYNDKESIVLINEAIESRKKDFGIIERSRIEKILLKINRIRIFNWINFRLK